MNSQEFIVELSNLLEERIIFSSPSDNRDKDRELEGSLEHQENVLKVNPRNNFLNALQGKEQPFCRSLSVS
jgi:hypothetical protein